MKPTLSRLNKVITALSFQLVFTNFLYSNTLDSLLSQTQKQLANNELEGAIQTFAKTEKVAKELDKGSQLWLYYQVKSDILGRQGNKRQNLFFKEESLKIANELENVGLQAESNISLASYYESELDNSKATPCILKALDYFYVLQNKERIAYLYNKLGLIHFSDNNYELAYQYFFGSFVIYNTVKNLNSGNAYWVQNNLLNMGLCLDFLKQPQRALNYYKIALNYCKTAPFERERPIGVISCNIGVIYGRLKNYKLAFQYLDSGIYYCLKPENQEIGHATQSLLILGSLKSENGNEQKADSIFNAAKKLIVENELNYLFKSYHNRLSKHFARFNKFELALKEKNRYFEIRDSLEHLKEKSDYEKLFLIHQLEKENLGNELLVQQNKYQKLTNNSLIVFTFMLGSILIWGLFSLRTYRKRNLKLTLLNNRITEQKERLEALNTELVCVNNNKNFLMQTIAHDLRAPLGNLMSLNNLLDDFVIKNAESEEYQKLISSSCYLALHIIEDILDQSLIERGVFKLVKQPVKVTNLLKETVSLLRFKFEPKQIQIITLFDVDLELNIDGDRIKRVFINLLMNAIKFSPRKSVIYVRQYLQNNSLYIKIEDQGIGMDAKTIANLFERGIKIGKDGIENEKSFGFGFTIVQSILEAHGGKIFVESEPNYGSTFYIVLPLS